MIKLEIFEKSIIINFIYIVVCFVKFLKYLL